MTPAELMFTRKMRYVLNKLLPNKKKTKKKKKNEIRAVSIFFRSGEVYFRIYRHGKERWESGIIDKLIGRLVYLIKGANWEHKRHPNKKR